MSSKTSKTVKGNKTLDERGHFTAALFDSAFAPPIR